MIWTLDLFSTKQDDKLKTFGWQCRDGNFQRKKALDLMPPGSTRPRPSKQTHTMGAYDLLEGRCVIGSDEGWSLLSMNRKTGFAVLWAEIITFYSWGSQRTIGWRKVGSFGGRSRGFTQSVLLSFTFRYSPTHEYKLSGLKETEVPVHWDSIATWHRREKPSPGDTVLFQTNFASVSRVFNSPPSWHWEDRFQDCWDPRWVPVNRTDHILLRFWELPFPKDR